MATTLTFQRTHNYAAQNRHGITIPVQLTAGERAVRLNAKLDTGASFCIFQRAYAEQLAIEVEKGERRQFQTANSSFPAFGHNVTLTCFDWQFDSTVYFPENPEIDRNVLGRAGWLQQFRLAIVDYDSILYLSHYDQREADERACAFILDAHKTPPERLGDIPAAVAVQPPKIMDFTPLFFRQSCLQ